MLGRRRRAWREARQRRRRRRVGEALRRGQSAPRGGGIAPHAGQRIVLRGAQSIRPSGAPGGPSGPPGRRRAVPMSPASHREEDGFRGVRLLGPHEQTLEPSKVRSVAGVELSGPREDGLAQSGAGELLGDAHGRAVEAPRQKGPQSRAIGAVGHEAREERLDQDLGEVLFFRRPLASSQRQVREARHGPQGRLLDVRRRARLSWGRAEGLHDFFLGFTGRAVGWAVRTARHGRPGEAAAPGLFHFLI
mmetsp:Transcript_22550/g.63638  ORF Transcript_22550/g.63638 Transcript_22550/m.63638 type:complete len:248 (+) Transcript_22550:485-1228(+)